MQPITKHSLFSLGQVVANTRRVDRSPKGGTTAAGVLARPPSGDWGRPVRRRPPRKTHSARPRLRLLSRYYTSAGEALYVITEADRSVTTNSFARRVLRFSRNKKKGEEK